MSILSGVLSGVEVSRVPQFVLSGDDVQFRWGTARSNYRTLFSFYVTMVAPGYVRYWVQPDAFSGSELIFEGEVPGSLTELENASIGGVLWQPEVHRAFETPLHFKFSQTAKDAYMVWLDGLKEEGLVS